MRRKSVKETLLAVFLTVAVAAAMIPAGVLMTAKEANAAETYSYTIKRTETFTVHGYKLAAITFTVPGLDAVGTCCEAGIRADSGKASFSVVSHSDNMVRYLWYGYRKGHIGKANKTSIILERTLSRSYGKSSRRKPVTYEEIVAYRKAANDYCKKDPVPDRFIVYLGTPQNKSQSFIAYRLLPKPKVTLVKKSSKSDVLKSGLAYTYSGIKYTVYDKNGKSAGTLTCNKDGKTNTLTLPDIGKYTVKETTANKWFRKNTKVYSKTFKGGEGTWKISASDEPEYAKIIIQKTAKGPGSLSGPFTFKFKLTNTKNTSITYSVTVTAKKTASGVFTGSATLTGVVAGTYRCVETDDAGFDDETGTQTATVAPGGTYTFRRSNEIQPPPPPEKKGPVPSRLRVCKQTTDGGPVAGFSFRVTGELYNYGTMTAAKLLETAAPSAQYDTSVYTIGSWTADEEDLAALNAAAKSRQTGERIVQIKNSLTYQNAAERTVSQIAEQTQTGATGTIAAGTVISDGGKVYRARRDASYEIACRDAQQDGDAETGDDGDGGEPDEPAEQVFDQETTEQNIRALLTGDAFEELDTTDKPLTAQIKVNLKAAEWVEENLDYETDLAKQIKNKQSAVEEDVTFNNFDWYGAGTLWQATLTTGENGMTPWNSDRVTAGKYTAEEVMTDAQAARYVQPASQTLEIGGGEGGPASLTFSFRNEARITPVKLKKLCEGGSVEGISFVLEGKNTLGEEVSIEGRTDQDGLIDFGDVFAGEYVVSETGFDSGSFRNTYPLDGYDVPAQRVAVRGDETGPVMVTFRNEPLKDLYLTKVDSRTHQFLENAVFSLVDEKGEAATFALVRDGEEVKIDLRNVRDGETLIADVVNDPAGGGGEQADEPEDNPEQTAGSFAKLKGLVPGRTYTIREIEAPEGYAPQVNLTFTFEPDMKLVLENTPPEIGTVAKDQETQMKMSNADGTATLVDTVAYENLTKGKTYVMCGTLVYKPDPDDPETAENVEAVKDADGNPVTAEKEFMAGNPDGTMKIEVPLDASALAGRAVVMYEQLYDRDGYTERKEQGGGDQNADTPKPIAVHEDPKSEAQSIYFPELKTEAVGGETGKHITAGSGETTIIDHVSYANVEAGRIYEITGILMDKETGDPVRVDGKEITASAKFKATEKGAEPEEEGKPLKEDVTEKKNYVSGSVDIRFTFDAGAYAGRSLVAFERLTAGNRLVGEHADISDEDQTVQIPVIGTKADIDGGSIRDKVAYRNLIPGEQYVMKGVLMDQSTGKACTLNGKEITKELEFTPKRKDGVAVIRFDVELSKLAGRTLVAFETCYIRTGGKEAEEPKRLAEVASHKNLNAKAQTVTIGTPPAGQAPQTGQTIPWLLAFQVAAMLAAAGCLLRKKQK